MSDAVQFLVRHGYGVLFIGVLAEQIGLPIPSVPFLLAAGVLAGNGQLNFPLAMGLALLGSVVGDMLWYELGRRRGSRVLQLLCRISLEPDSCVRRTENVFARHGVRSLLIAKFIPGLNTAAPPLAGVFRMRRWRFLLYDGLGALAWVGAFAGLGYLFSDQLEKVGTQALRLGSWLGAALIGGFGAYIFWKYLQRRRFLQQLRIDRITPEELKQKLDANQEVVIVDLRHSLDFEAQPYIIPGALPLPTEQWEERHHEIPRGRDIVLYCS